jgi:Flp pilus assembly protein TadB
MTGRERFINEKKTPRAMDFRRFYKFYAYASGCLFVFVMFAMVVSRAGLTSYFIAGLFLIAAYYFWNNAKEYEKEKKSKSEKK